MKLGIHSFRGRFVTVSIVYITILTIIAWWAKQYVQDYTTSSLANTEIRQDFRQQLAYIKSNAAELKSSLLEFLIVASSNKRDLVLYNNNKLRYSIEEFENTQTILPTQKLVTNPESLKQDLDELGKNIESLTVLRLNINKLYPGTPIQQNEMLPLNIEFITATTQALEVENKQKDYSEEQFKIAKLFNEAQYAWSNMIGAFRMYVSNRSGIFGNPESGMTIQETNLHLYQDEVMEKIKKLDYYNKAGLLDIVQTESYEKMKDSLKKWHHSFERVKDVYTSPDWRKDIPILNQKIHPTIRIIEDRLKKYEHDLYISESEDIHVLHNIARLLSSSIIYIGIIALAISAISFLLFEYAINKPLNQIINCFHAETKGVYSSLLPKTNIKEIKDLVTSFAIMREQIHSRQNRLESILDTVAEAVLTLDINGFIKSFNRSAEKLFDYSSIDILDRHISVIIPPSRHSQLHSLFPLHQHRIPSILEEQASLRDATVVPVTIKMSEVMLDGEPYYNTLIADVREQKEKMDQLRHIAEHDGLTGLYNKSFFMDELERSIKRLHRNNSGLHALLYIDLDNFKYINDTFGHSAGDELLIKISDIVKSRSRDSDICARLGGDEFAILLFDIHTNNASDVAESIRISVEQNKFSYKGNDCDFGCSIGITLIDPNTNTAESALRKADSACQVAKRHGRNHVYLYAPEKSNDNDLFSDDTSWVEKISEALEHNHFELLHQPILNIKSGEIGLYEIFLRMKDKNGDIMPSAFFKIAERLRLATSIDKWVVKNTIAYISKNQLDSSIFYSINLSMQTLRDLEACDSIVKIIHDGNVEPGKIIFEITEAATIADIGQAEEFLSRMKLAGCQTALDDFGSGMSSLTYLRNLSIDYVKIDGQHIRNAALNDIDFAIIDALNDISHAMKIKTIAKSVEDETCLKKIKTAGIDYAQGYALGKPEKMIPINK
ncbi:MAG: EAL domain-containing protein [Gammaproteobacteria bacterium]|nr:EAL domain-containing protein [Gammaproteobacteria bacterium]